jgi:hypothetical protein
MRFLSQVSMSGHKSKMLQIQEIDLSNKAI